MILLYDNEIGERLCSRCTAGKQFPVEAGRLFMGGFPYGVGEKKPGISREIPGLVLRFPKISGKKSPGSCWPNRRRAFQGGIGAVLTADVVGGDDQPMIRHRLRVRSPGARNGCVTVPDTKGWKSLSCSAIPGKVNRAAGIRNRSFHKQTS